MPAACLRKQLLSDLEKAGKGAAARTVGGSAQLGPALLELLSQVQRPHRRDQHRPVEEPRALQHHLLGGRDEGAVPVQRGAALAVVGPGIVRDRRAVV